MIFSFTFNLSISFFFPKTKSDSSVSTPSFEFNMAASDYKFDFKLREMVHGRNSVIVTFLGFIFFYSRTSFLNSRC